MIILDEATNKNLTNITILLTRNEASQMIGCLEDLLSEAGQNTHYHLNNDSYSKEITIASYDKIGCLDNFSEKYKKLISADETVDTP